ncbi:MAG: hypothetical protein WD688_03815 [Candidatus Binatia bacterium]
MREIGCAEARDKRGIYTVHHQMDNLELRFRLKKTDGTAYIRTESSAVGGWQESHYHNKVRETYIVQKGWIGYAELTKNGPGISIFCEGELFTTQPGVIHNVFMPANAVIHTVKHGDCTSDDRNTAGTSDFNSYCTNLKSEKEILDRDSRTSRTSYSEEYRHFDNLIWQVPAWATAIFALSLQGLSADNIRGIAKIAAVTQEQLAVVFLFTLSLMILCFSHVMYRFRVHQKSLKEYQGASTFRSASTYTQFMVTAQAASLFVLALSALKVPMWLAVGVAAAGLLGWTIYRERRLRFGKDSVKAKFTGAVRNR